MFNGNAARDFSSFSSPVSCKLLPRKSAQHNRDNELPRLFPLTATKPCCTKPLDARSQRRSKSKRSSSKWSNWKPPKTNSKRYGVSGADLGEDFFRRIRTRDLSHSGGPSAMALHVSCSNFMDRCQVKFLHGTDVVQFFSDGNMRWWKALEKPLRHQKAIADCYSFFGVNPLWKKGHVVMGCTFETIASSIYSQCSSSQHDSPSQVLFKDVVAMNIGNIWSRTRGMSLCVLQWHEFEYMLYYHMNDMIICPDYLYGCFSCQPNGKSAFWDSTTSSHPTWMFQILVGMSGKQENNLVLWSTILVSYYGHIKWVCTSINDDPLQCLPIYQHQQLFGNVHKALLTIFHELRKNLIPRSSRCPTNLGPQTFHSRVGHATNSLFDMEYHDLSTFTAMISNEESMVASLPSHLLLPNCMMFVGTDYEKMSILPQG